MPIVNDISVGQSPKNGRRWFIFAIRALLTLGIFALLFTWLRPAELFTAMSRIGVTFWLLTVVIHILIHVIVVTKWRILLDAAGSRIELIDAVRAHAAGVFANLYLPSIVGGDIVRAGLASPSRNDLPAVITGGVADRITDCASLVILATGGLLFMPAAHTGINLRILAVAATGLFGSVFGIQLALKVLHRKILPAPLASAISGLKLPIETMFQRKRSTLLALAVSLSIQSAFVVQNVFIGKAIGINVPAAVWFVAWPLAKLASLTPLSLGGLGVREGVLAAMLIPFSVPVTLSVAASLVWQTVMYALGLFGGVTSLWIGHFRAKREIPITVTRAEI